MRRKKAALYDPYLDTLGGGEKHILSILKIIQEEGFDFDIFWNQNLNKAIISKFNIHFSTAPTYFINIFKLKIDPLSKAVMLKKYDLFFYVTDGSYFFSSAKKNFVFCMVPQKSLYQMTILNKLKTANYQFISNSNYTTNWLKKWHIKAETIYPYLDNNYLNLNTERLKKDKVILSVGRFFRNLHAKRQDLMIKVFKELKQKFSLFKDFKLILAGGLKEEDMDYFNELKKITSNEPSIILLPNTDYSQLFELYKNSLIYWHFAGFGIDENLSPELAEHLGITPLEAMACGCMTFCYKAGGPKEIIEDNSNGFLFINEKELISKTQKVVSDHNLQKKIQGNAKKYLIKNFDYLTFKKRVKNLILNNII